MLGKEGKIFIVSTSSRHRIHQGTVKRQQWYVPYMALAPKGFVKVYLVSSVIHFNVITVDIDMLISIVKHCACE